MRVSSPDTAVTSRISANPARCMAMSCVRRMPMPLIRSLDVSSAASMAGVHLVATADDLAADGLGHMPCLAAVKPMIVPPRPALATGRVRHVGDPVCFIVADSAEIAREAAERIEIDYEPLPSVVDGRTALADERAAPCGTRRRATSSITCSAATMPPSPRR